MAQREETALDVRLQRALRNADALEADLLSAHSEAVNSEPVTALVIREILGTVRQGILNRIGELQAVKQTEKQP